MDEAQLYKILFYSTMIVWLFPPIRQVKTKLFYFFLILAIIDPIAIIYAETFNYPLPLFYWIIGCFLLLIAIIDKKDFIKKMGILFLLLIMTLMPTFFSSDIIFSFLGIELIYFFIFAIFLTGFIKEYAIEKKVNLFKILLLFYILTAISKILLVMLGYTYATPFFIITSIFQAIIGLYFSIFREDNPRFIFKLQ